MSDKAGIKRDYTRNFHLDEGKLRKLADVLKIHGQKYGEDTYLRYYVNREDDSFYETREIDEVLADDNVPCKAIKMLAIELHKVTPDPLEISKPESDRTPLVILAFRKNKDEKVIFSTAAKNRDWCFLLADDLDSQIARLLKGKSIRYIQRRSIDLIFLASASAIVLLIAAWFASRPLSPLFSIKQIIAMSADQRSFETLKILSNREISVQYIYPLMIVIMTIFIVLMEVRPIARLIDKLDRSVFYWGDMIAEYDKYQKYAQLVKWGIVGTFIIGLLSSIVATYIMR